MENPSEIREAAMLEAVSWLLEGDLPSAVGILAKRKRQREDAALSMKVSREVRQRMADMILSRVNNKFGDPVIFLADVDAGRLDRMATSRDIRRALYLADRGLLTVFVNTQIAGPWSNTIPPTVRYHFELTDAGKALLPTPTKDQSHG